MVEPVARIQSIHLIGGHASLSGPSGSYVPGHFYPLGNGRSASSTGALTKVPLVVIRGDTFAVGAMDMMLNVHDFIRTGPESLAAIEFLIGGRVGINKGTIVEITSERSVADGPTSLMRIGMKNAALWLRGGTSLKKLEIQTNGGVMGIKG